MRTLALTTAFLALACASLRAETDMPAWARSLSIYEVAPEVCTQHGTFKELQQRLPDIKKLGIHAVWLMPIYPRGGNPPGKPASNSSYCVRDYFDVNAAYGTKEDLRSLVKAAHALRMRVLLDFVPNHTSWGNALVKEHPEFYKKNAAGEIVAPGPWADVAQLDYGNKALWDYIYRAHAYWVKEFGVDGFREDVAGAVPLEFWQWLRPKLAAIRPVFLLAEADEARLHPAFDATYDWHLQAYLYMIARGAWQADSLDRMLDEERKKFPAGYLRMRHLTNHDMNYMGYAWDNRAVLGESEIPFLEKTSLTSKYAGGQKPFAVLCATLPNSLPMLWNGQEHGLLEHIDKVPWDQASPYLDFYSALLNEYRRNPALTDGDFVRLQTGSDKAVYAFVRRSGKSHALVVLNLTDKPQVAAFVRPEVAGEYLDVFTGDKIRLSADCRFALDPWQAVVLGGSRK